METKRSLVMPLTERTYKAYVEDLAEWIERSEAEEKQELEKKKARIEGLWKRLNKKTN